MGEQPAGLHLRLDPGVRVRPGETRPDIRAIAGLRVAAVMAHADLEARHQPPAAEPELQRSLKPHPQPRDLRLGRRHRTRNRLRARAHDEAVGDERKLRTAALRRAQEFAAQPRSRHRQIHVCVDPGVPPSGFSMSSPDP